MKISFVLRTLRMLINIFSFSYFIGMAWLIMCKIVEFVSYNSKDGHEDIDTSKFFLEHFDL